MRFLTNKRKGELFILSGSLLWSFFPVITILTFSSLPPLFSASVSTLLSAVFFALLLTVRKQWIFLTDTGAWKDMFLTSLYIGVIFYGLMFTGLHYTTAGNGAIMALMEVFFSFLILGVLLRHERIAFRSLIGALCMVLGAAVILLPKTSGWNGGDLLVILATVFPPLGNKYAQRARERVTSECIMFVRSFLSGAFLLLLAFALEPFPAPGTLRDSFPFLLANGILLLGFSKILWIEGINLISITEATSLGSIAPAFTLLIAFFALHENVSAFQIAGFVPIVAGVILLTHRRTPATARESVPA